MRSHATRLRHRLELYFETQGMEEPLRLEIPRGGYVPRFYTVELRAVAADTAPEPIEETAIEAPPEPPEVSPDRVALAAPRRAPWFARVFAGAVVVLLATAGVYFSPLLPVGHGKAPRQTNVERRFWTGLLGNNARTLVVAGDSGLVLYESFGRQDVSLSEYIAGNYHRFFSPSPLVSPELAQDLSTRRYTSVADLNLAIRLSRLPEWNDQRAEVVFARDMRAADAARSNLVLIGSRQANPWESLIDSSMNFELTPDGSGRFYFLNRHPLPGEQATYRPSQNGSVTSDSSVYALICFRPGDNGVRNILLLSGLWQSGTEAAGEYVLSDRHFVDFLSRIARRDGSFPGFELLVQVRSVAGNAFTSSIVASRVQ